MPQGLPVRRKQKIYEAIEPEVPTIVQSPERNVKNEFENLFNGEVDLEVELAKFKPAEQAGLRSKPRYKVIQRKAIPILTLVKPEPRSDIKDQELNKIISEIQHSAASVRNDPAPAEPAPDSGSEFQLSPPARHDDLPEFYARRPLEKINSPATTASAPLIGRKDISFTGSHSHGRRINKRWLILGLAGAMALGAIGKYGLNLKHNITQESAAAVGNLQSAQANLKALDFQGAADNFSQAFQNFSKAGNNLNVMGATLSNMLAELPGATSVKSAKNLIQVGQLLSDAGSAMTQAMDAIAKTGVILNPTANNVPVGGIMSALQQALKISNADVTKAASLLADVDESIIPPDKKADFDKFKSELPVFAQTISESSDYAKFFTDMINAGGYKRYLVLFENSSELRPTGGFPGTYGVVSFKDGKLDDFFVDDVYNLDGQLKQNIVPPLQMQFITPTWGMRDAAWFADYPTSARKIEDFYTKESGQSVDGVIVVNPQIISDIMSVVGPIQMPDYNLTLTKDNILTTMQSQVEYGPNRAQPKQVLKDFAPLLLRKIYSAKSEQWLSIFNSLIAAMDNKEMLMFFNDLSLESFVTDKGFGGQVKQVSGDYLMPIITNLKGSKTDAVTDTSFTLDTKLDGSDALHTLTITRAHNGGKEKYGFYNKQNSAYVRVLVPDGAELVSVSGNDNPNFRALVDYSKGFTRDDQLTSFETSGRTDTTTGVTTYREAGKSEFGFWLITDPGQTKTVTAQYRVAKAVKDKTYQLYIQKQPGLVVKNFKFSLQSSGLTPDASAPLLTPSGSAYEYASPLTNDLPIKVTFK